MTAELTINERGSLTIPAKLRRELGLRGNDRLVAHVTGGGLFLQPAVSVPIELYTDERIEEFLQQDEAVGEVLDRIERREQTPPA